MNTDINKKSLVITNNSILKFSKPFKNFEIDKLVIKCSENVDFQVKIAFSLDNTNWSANYDITEITDEITLLDVLDFNVPDFNDFIVNIPNQQDGIYISIWFDKIERQISESSLNQKFAENYSQRITLLDVEYDSYQLDYKIETLEVLVNKFPRWNLYDNQQVMVTHWLAQCCAIAQMYGHFSIYFKSTVTKKNNTLATNVNREIVSIKKFPVQFPGNELPQDRNVYSDWDYPLIDEVMIHVVDELFKKAFGYDSVPQAGDFLYVPLINKLFKVTAVQPKNGYMGKIGWWEVFLGKYEDDETLGMSKDLHENFSTFEDYGAFEDYDGLIEELETIENETVFSADSVLMQTIDEKKEVTENFTNKLVDSTDYIDLKETENQRKFYSKRLDIISLNPENNAFPVTMYDCTKVERNIVGLTYDLKDAVSVNKKSLIIDNEFSLSFNYVTTKKFSSRIIVTDNFYIESVKDKLSIFDINNQKQYDIDFVFESLEYYQINVSYNKKLRQYSVIIFILRNKQKKLVYQNLYIDNVNNQAQIIDFTEICLMGGSFYFGELIFTIDNDKIITDYVNPILNMQKF